MYLQLRIQVYRFVLSSLLAAVFVVGNVNGWCCGCFYCRCGCCCCRWWWWRLSSTTVQWFCRCALGLIHAVWSCSLFLVHRSGLRCLQCLFSCEPRRKNICKQNGFTYAFVLYVCMVLRVLPHHRVLRDRHIWLERDFSRHAAFNSVCVKCVYGCVFVCALFFRPSTCVPNVTFYWVCTCCNTEDDWTISYGTVPSASLKTRATTIELSMHHLFFPSEHIGD